jgi:hypothetical protein
MNYLTSPQFISDQANAWSEIRELFSCSPLTNPETANGPGCTVEATTDLRAWLPGIFAKYEITSMLDAACGDFNWMQHVDLTGVSYTGWDVEPRMVQENAKKWPQHTWACNNLLNQVRVPKVDLILARQILIHFPNDYIHLVLDNFKLSGSTYLLASHWPEVDNDFTYDPNAGAWVGYMERPVNLEAPPFSLSAKLDAVREPPGPFGVLKDGHELALFRL